jgi:hypothetical protein
VSFVWAAAVVVAFAAAIEVMDLPDRAREVGRRSAECVTVLKDPSLDDDEKERALQKHSLRLFTLLAILVGGSVLALGLPLGGVALLDLAGAASLDRVLAVLQRVDVLVGATVLGGAAYLLVRRVGRS